MSNDNYDEDLSSAAVTDLTTNLGNKVTLQETDEIVQLGDGSKPTVFRRKVTKQKEVPIVRKVRVPVTTRKVVPTTLKKRVKTTQLVEVADFEEVKEEYTEYKIEKATREKKVWVKKVIDEEYTKKVPVVKTRKVKKPVTRIVEKDDWQTVTVKGTKIEEVNGFRIDEVEEFKLVEEEVWEVFELLPQATGETMKGEFRELGMVDGSSSRARKIGTKVYDEQYAQVQFKELETDHQAAGQSSAPLYVDGDEKDYETLRNTLQADGAWKSNEDGVEASASASASTGSKKSRKKKNKNKQQTADEF